MIVINKQSKTFKFYDLLSKVFFFSLVTPINQHWNGNSTAIFRDICTFARTNLLYIFLSLPLMLAFIGTIIFTIYSIISAAITLSFNPTIQITGFFLAIASGIALLCGIVFSIFYIIEKSSKKFENNTFINLVTTSIKNKHNSFCQIIKVVDEPKSKE